jgi:periplasmic protein CpxP/Spy
MSLSTLLSTNAKRRSLAAFAALSLASLMSAASAQAPTAPPSNSGRPDMARMAERRIEHMIKEVDGTPEQKAKLTQLAQLAAKDLQPLHEQHMAARRKGMELLAAPSVDRTALEKLRTEQTQLMDGISRRMLMHMADAAEVLTPAQRNKLAEKMKVRGEDRGGWGGHRGGHGGGWFR